VLICYEAIYAGLARELRRGGAQWLVNLSNDSWFDAGGGPQQHLQAVRLRAIEQRMSVIRATNSGISAVISPTGRELLRLPADTATAVALRVTATRATALYTWSGDLFAWTCVGLSLFGLFLKERRNR
jgi:apolipoprotein N-acyltransferase